MDTLPPEVLRIICTHLSFPDAAALRFLARNLSEIAAEFLVTRIRFHTSRASLDRLEKVSQHPVFSQTVKVLVYEAALLADVRCRQEYAKHFEMDHRGLERPREPSLGCSERERRLYSRNKSKWNGEIYAKYDTYRSLFESQKALLDNSTLEKVLSECIPRFSKLTFIDVDPIRRCSHMTSKRFIEEFGSDCVSPLSGNFGKIGDQFKYMLFPNDSVIPSLRKLEINSLSPSFFKDSQRHLFKAAFSHLLDVDIVLKLADKDIKNNEPYRVCFHRHLSNGVLKDALAAAANLEAVSIGVESPLLLFVNVSDVISNTVWKRLRSVSLCTLTTTQRELMDFLKRQPSLKSVSLTLMQLTQGLWIDTIDEMRDQLRLQSFIPAGVLEDPEETYPLDLISTSIYQDSYEEFDLGSAVERYVTCTDSQWGGNMPNPLIDCWDDYEEADTVRDLFGTLSDMDFSFDDLSDDEMDWSDSDIMPDLETII